MNYSYYLQLCFALLAGNTLAEITHVSQSKGLRIPRGSYTQFKLAGQGLNDDNLKADITQTRTEIHVKGTAVSSKFGLLSDDTFDVFVFDNDEDYDCYIEASTLYLAHGHSK